jgi:hypothetical protein
MMQRFRICLLPAVLLATLSFYSCKKDTAKEPDQPVTVDSNAVDNGLWNLDERMDLTYRPGDNFDMYCSGTWWQTAVPGQYNGVTGFMEGDLMDVYIKNVDAIQLPFMQKLADMTGTTFSNPEPSAALMAKAVNMINEAATVEDMWHVMGKLMKAGYKTPFRLVSYATNGVTCPVFMEDKGTEFPVSGLSKAKLLAEARNRSPHEAFRVLRADPAKAPKSVAEGEWPMFHAMCTELGIDPTNAFAINDIGDESDFNSMSDSLVFYKMQAMGLDELKAEILKWVETDRALYDVAMYDGDAEMGKNMLALLCGGMGTVTTLFTNYLNYTCSYYLTQTKGWSPAQGQAIKNMCMELRQVFRDRLKQNTWLSEAGKRNAELKLDAMQDFVVVPDKWFEEGVTSIDTCTTLLSSVLTIRANHYAFVKFLQGKPRNEAAFHALIDSYMSVASLNACYVPNFNAIFIMPIFCFQPFYDPAYNMALNYGHFVVIGHEISHGFDSAGSNYGPDGTLGEFWANEADKQEFDNRVKKVVDFYSTLRMENGRMLDAVKTKVENTADICGLTITYQAYCNYLAKHGFTGEQLQLQKKRFFMAYAHLFSSKYTMETLNERMDIDTHSPLPARVNGAVPQMDDWYTLFDVKEGDKLYLSPDNRVRIW